MFFKRFSLTLLFPTAFLKRNQPILFVFWCQVRVGFVLYSANLLKFALYSANFMTDGSNLHRNTPHFHTISDVFFPIRRGLPRVRASSCCSARTPNELDEKKDESCCFFCQYRSFFFFLICKSVCQKKENIRLAKLQSKTLLKHKSHSVRAVQC